MLWIRTLRMIPGFSLVARYALGLVFIIASIDKIANPEAFAASIEAYRILPLAFVNAPAIVLPWVELLCGLFLIGGVYMRASSVLLSLLLILFIASMGIAMARGLTINCGCFGPEHATPVGWGKIAENVLLLLLAGFCYGLEGQNEATAADSRSGGG